MKVILGDPEIDLGDVVPPGQAQGLRRGSLHIGYEIATVALVDEDALRGKELEGLAHRKAGDAEPLRQFLCGDVRPDSQPGPLDMVEDLRGQPVGHFTLAAG
jgi:hypothetical protein